MSDNLLPEFFLLLRNAQDASEAVDMHPSVDPDLEAEQRETCVALVRYVLTNGESLLRALESLGDPESASKP